MSKQMADLIGVAVCSAMIAGTLAFVAGVYSSRHVKEDPCAKIGKVDMGGGLCLTSTQMFSLLKTSLDNR